MLHSRVRLGLSIATGDVAVVAGSGSGSRREWSRVELRSSREMLEIAVGLTGVGRRLTIPRNASAARTNSSPKLPACAKSSAGSG